MAHEIKKTTFKGKDFRRKSQSIKIKLVDIINVKFTEKKITRKNTTEYQLK